MSKPIYDVTLLTAQSLSATTSDALPVLARGQHCTIFVESSAGVSAGVVTIEEAHDSAYSGTWSSITTVTTSAASTCTAVHFLGAYGAVRVRISTAITGGTVTVRALVGE